ncbi:MAG: diguanylate cyclase [Blautia sp.]|nr:diguanylate cyclase [Blautia sp.]
MTEYYTAIVFLSCLALCVMGILVFENGRFDKKTKYRFYETYALIILASVAEWAGVVLNGAPGWTKGIHALMKCLDYIATPIAGVLFVRQVSQRNRLQKYMWILLAANAVFEVLSVFTGWSFYIDAENYYHHGPLYLIYVAVFILAIIFVLMEFLFYGRKYKRKNRFSLCAIIFLVCLGIALQEIIGGVLRTSIFALNMGSILLFIHYSEFQQQKSDDDIFYQKTLIDTDVLTGMLSRYAYTETMKEYSQKQILPENLVVFVIDINGLKTVNDNMGHEAGDELICGAAACIAEALGPYGKCFRTGGDEFAAILEMDTKKTEEVLENLNRTAAKWKGKMVDHLSLSSGYAIAREYPEMTVDKIVNLADRMMYINKAEYHACK